MACRNRSSSSGSSSSSDIESDSSSEEIYLEEETSEEEELRESLAQLQPYQFEPEVENFSYGTESDSDEASSIFDDEVRIESKDRVGGKQWCSCGCCQEESREVDCLCCKEVSAIDEVKFEGKYLYSCELLHRILVSTTYSWQITKMCA